MSTIVVRESNNEAEALAIQQMLEDIGVVCAITSHRDTAYPGIVDRVAGGFQVRVAADDVDRARELIAEFDAAASVMPLEEAATTGFGTGVPRIEAPQTSPWASGSAGFWLIAAVGVGIAAWYVFFRG